MVLVLCIGDLHIPHRAADLPPKFRELLKPGKIHSILCTGNVCSKAFLDYLRGVSLGEFHVVQGDFDDFNAPDHSIVQIADFTIGLCHGHQAIPWGNQESVSLLQRQLDVDILVTGHTHEYKTMRSGDRLQINPGSATGAYNSLNKSTAPSFVLMDLDGSKATVYVYQLVGGEVKVEKIEYIKPAPAAVPAAAAAGAPAVTALAS